MRLFIAIPLPEDIKEYMASIQERFKGFPLQSVKKEQMHLTIDFLGEIPDNEVGWIARELEKIRSRPFTIKLTGIGTFPSNEKIRVIWIGIEKDETFIELQKNVRKIFNHRGKLMPHLTIARAKDIIKDNRLSGEIKNIGTRPQEFLAERFILYRSDPTPEGYVHSIVQGFELD